MGHYQTYQYTHNRTPRKREETGTGSIVEEIMAKNFPTLMKYMNLHIQEVQRNPSRINTTISKHTFSVQAF